MNNITYTVTSDILDTYTSDIYITKIYLISSL